MIIEKLFQEDDFFNKSSLNEKYPCMFHNLYSIFRKQIITKDEYKLIMKKGVTKLRKRDSLKPKKVESFVKKYVGLVVSDRPQ
jgi:hypothetical protein